MSRALISWCTHNACTQQFLPTVDISLRSLFFKKKEPLEKKSFRGPRLSFKSLQSRRGEPATFIHWGGGQHSLEKYTFLGEEEKAPCIDFDICGRGGPWSIKLCTVRTIPTVTTPPELCITCTIRNFQRYTTVLVLKNASNVYRNGQLMSHHHNL